MEGQLAYIDQLKREVADLKWRLHNMKFTPATEWGNCRRGCPESYLDAKGFCSPACAMGAPKGEFVTVGKVGA
jgi:hypothetical protein